MSELKSTGPKLVPLLATKFHYQGVHLTKGQPDPQADHMSFRPAVVPLLTTRCLYLGGMGVSKGPTGHVWCIGR